MTKLKNVNELKTTKIMNDFIKKMLELGAELEQTNSPMQATVIINDAEILYNNHQKQVNVTLGNVSGCWTSQKDKDIMTYHAGSTLLVRFEDSDIGITSDDGSTVDVSWFRTPSKDQVHTTSGSFSSKMIRDYKLIE